MPCSSHIQLHGALQCSPHATHAYGDAFTAQSVLPAVLRSCAESMCPESLDLGAAPLMNSFDQALSSYSTARIVSVKDITVQGAKEADAFI